MNNVCFYLHLNKHSFASGILHLVSFVQLQTARNNSYDSFTFHVNRKYATSAKPGRVSDVISDIGYTNIQLLWRKQTTDV